MKNHLKKLTYIWAFLLPLMAFQVSAQNTIVTGIVTDAKDKDPLPYVTLLFKGTSIITRTDADGKFTISSPGNYSELQFSFVGYGTKIIAIKPGEVQEIAVKMDAESTSLNEVVISSGKRPSYKNKNNPAVELIRRVIDHKNANRMESYDQVEYKQYEKMVFSMSNLSEKFKNKRIFRKYQFLFDEQDSTKIGGKNILPIFIQEKLSQNYYNKNPEKNKMIVLGDKSVNYETPLIDSKGLSQYFERMYADVDIYANNISLVSNQFLSPIADGAPTFYKFFITDTIKSHSPQLIELSFIPRNNTDLLFEGRIYITMDGNYAVQDAFLTVNKNINLNFVRALEVKLNFEKNTAKRYYLNKTNLLVDFGINKNKGGGFTGERIVTLSDYQINKKQPEDIFQGPKIVIVPDAEKRGDQFWLENRTDTLSAGDLKIYKNVDTLKNMSSFKKTMDLVTLLFAGYKDFGPFEVGPVNTFYSFNNVEGLRLRLGGRTTPALSKRYYFETYSAYGFKDEKWKYFLSGTYSLNNKSIYSFPQSYLRASFQRDTKIPGQELQFVQEDNFLLSFKRGENNMMLYNDIYKVEFMKEFENHFSYNVSLKKWSQKPGGELYFNNILDGRPNVINNINTSEIGFAFRYAKNERFYQGKIYRTPIIDKYPVFNLRYIAGLKGLLDGEYNYHKFNGSIDKRFYLSQLGYSDVTVEGGYIFGKVPFPLLSIHRANQTYAYQLNSYNLMNFLEFVSDHYASLNIDHNFNGFFLNKIPLIKKLKLRESVSFKILYGGLRAENNPAYDQSLLQFPVADNGVSTTYNLNKDPYMEGSVGIGNIFKLLRIDLVKRFNYLDHPVISEWGIRARVKFDF
ncbi:hypothetical protein AAKU52_002154 [Pedobacter sp. CG_S7]|uniref:DUF5686 and carboxypeptidase-like regulatory domain-containing protein n=1 Tax=Pedobacter sp. CG_S7 TaxID=3143930 RepID=UPI0033914078